jgi:hypothetical protein
MIQCPLGCGLGGGDVPIRAAYLGGMPMKINSSQVRPFFLVNEVLDRNGHTKLLPM